MKKRLSITMPRSGDVVLVIPQKFVEPLRESFKTYRLDVPSGEQRRLAIEALEWFNREMSHV